MAERLPDGMHKMQRFDRLDIYDPWLIKHTKSAVIAREKRWCICRVKNAQTIVFVCKSESITKRYKRLHFPQGYWEIAEYYGPLPNSAYNLQEILRA